MLQVLADNVFLTIFLVIALGAGVGAIPFGGIRFGAAGTLFAGLLVGALIPEPSADLVMLQNLGLGLFVYLVGLEAGETFFKELKAQLGMMITSVVAIAVGAVVAIVAGLFFNLSSEMIVGIFSGALTNTPSLALAQSQTGSELPAVGYSIAYPAGVLVAILIVSAVVGRQWKAPKDQTPEEGGTQIEVARVKLERSMTVEELVAAGEGQVGVAALRRNGKASVVDRDRGLEAGDVVALWAPASVLPGVVDAIGQQLPRRVLRDQHVRLGTFTVSNSELTGRPVSELPLYKRFGAAITTIRRVDQEILATPDTYLQEGDVVEVALRWGGRSSCPRTSVTRPRTSPRWTWWLSPGASPWATWPP